MATPPPEVPAALKQEKLQLPPSPTGGSGSELAPSSAPAISPDQATMEGSSLKTNSDHSHTPAPTNGTDSAISPKSPPHDVSGKTATDDTAPAASTNHESPSTTGILPVSAPAASVAAHTLPLSAVPGAVNGSSMGTESKSPPSPGGSSMTGLGGSGGVKEEKQIPPDTPGLQSPSVKRELPHHPSVAHGLSTDGADDEMEDVFSPQNSTSKVSREREMDTSDEPAAKRAKMNNGNGTRATESAPMTPGQHKFLTKQIAGLRRAHDSRFYRTPVDPIALNIPNYPLVIKQPMDLGTIERKLKNKEYATAQALHEDFSLMIQNALTFNGPDHLVAQEGVKLLATFEKQLVHLPRADESEDKKKPPKKSGTKASPARRDRTALGGNAVPRAPAAAVPPPVAAAAPKASSPQSSTFALGPEGLPVIRRDSANADGRPKRSIHPPKRDLPYSTKPKKKKYQWELRFCQEVLEELYKTKHQAIAMAFYYPVDPVALNIPTYHSVIKHPMDLSTIKAKLSTGQYENAKEFHGDVKLMFKNCYRFNMVGDPIYLAGKSLEEVFDKKWSTKQEYLARHEPPPEQHNSESSEDESEEEAEESDEESEKLLELQRKIAEMSRQVEMIQKKKKTPPAKKATTKSGKTTAKKETKKSTGKKDKKTKSVSKPEKTRNITYNEKQIISNGISSLPDKKMQEALGIIQQNVPALKGTQEAEIELDIDELPNDVLLLLLKFVRKNAPHVLEEEEPAPSGGNAAPAAPKPKKNKPMSKYEQEAQINMLESNLSRFQGGSGSPNPMPSVEANESSDDESDDESEESEEE
ncbi:Bromo domain-containing protein [Penicillium ucsense]|uniref:Bromo domain-containing protein n=1 Tax=Penicillium ucsense TaxID=2839758 RepID=A0A8J8WM86_9EURO|nr:Bromo domain-containing protein [Penicillium ucsense]KAF7738732.1 Bromo domain-containing protein [Penicillium ucsense]